MEETNEPAQKRLKSIIKYEKHSDESSSKDGARISKKTFSDWREGTENHSERVKHALDQGLFTDVTFSVGSEQKLFHAHKVILALASPVFEAMFYGLLKETSEIIHITDIMPGTFKLLLDYIYTDTPNISNEDEAFAAWHAADKYCLPEMKALCYKHLCQCTLTFSNVWTILENSLFLDCEVLINRSLVFLQYCISDALKYPTFLESSSEVIMRILLLDILSIKEVTLLEHIVKWSMEKSKDNVKEALQPFMPYIRFGCMSQKDFIQFLDQYKGIISDSDALEILKYMTDNQLYALPEWCSDNVLPRKVLSGNSSQYPKPPSSTYLLKSQSQRYSHEQDSVEREVLSIRSYFSPIRGFPYRQSDSEVNQGRGSDYGLSSSEVMSDDSSSDHDTNWSSD